MQKDKKHARLRVVKSHAVVEYWGVGSDVLVKALLLGESEVGYAM